MLQNHSVLTQRLVIQIEVDCRWSLIRRRYQIEVSPAESTCPPAMQVDSSVGCSSSQTSLQTYLLTIRLTVKASRRATSSSSPETVESSWSSHLRLRRTVCLLGSGINLPVVGPSMGLTFLCIVGRNTFVVHCLYRQNCENYLSRLLTDYVTVHKRCYRWPSSQPRV